MSIKRTLYFIYFSPFTHRPDGAPLTPKDKIKNESKDMSLFKSPLHSPPEGVQVLDPAHLPDDSNDELSSLVDSPNSDTPALSEESEFGKMSMYSPTQQQFSVPEDIGTEAQSSSSLSASAVSDVQGAKHYMSDEYPASTTSEPSASFYSPTTSRSFQSISHSPLVSPSTYPAFNPQAFPTGSAEGMMTSAMYPNGACMSPSAYMSSYGAAGKQYTWPTTPSGYGAFGMSSHDLMQVGNYTSAYPSGSYSQMTTMSRPGYPATYFSPQVTATTHAS